MAEIEPAGTSQGYSQMMQELLGTPSPNQPNCNVPDFAYYLTEHRGLRLTPGMRYVFSEIPEPDQTSTAENTLMIASGNPVTTNLMVEVYEDKFFVLLTDDTSPYPQSRFSGKETFARSYDPHTVSPPATDTGVLLQGYVTRDDSWQQSFIPWIKYPVSGDPETIGKTYQRNAQLYLSHGQPTEENPFVPASLAERLLTTGTITII